MFGQRTLGRWCQLVSCWLVARSGQFDPVFYCEEYSDVAEADITPLEHYCFHGWREARRPSLTVHLGYVAIGPIGRYFPRCNPIVIWMLFGRWLGWSLGWPQLQNWRSVAARPVSGHIAFVLHEATRTGAPIFALRLARWMRRAGDAEPVFVLLADGSLLPEIWAEFTCLPLFAVARHERRHFLQGALKEVPALYLNSLASLHSWPWLEWHDRGVLIHIHESAVSLPAYATELSAIAAVRPRIVAVNDACYAPLVDLTGIRPDIVPPAIERTRSLGMPSPRARKPMIVGCGTRSRRKGADLFCHVAAKVSEQFEGELEFRWLGGVGDVDMKDLLERSGLSDQVHLMGEVANPLPLLAEAKVLMLPSRDDPFPLVALEAASCGVPVVCFDVLADGVGTWIIDKAGAIVPAFDIEAMADAVVRLLTDPVWHQAASEAAFKATQRFDIDTVGSRIGGIIDEMTSEALESLDCSR